jgi:hypothetical protein
MHPVEEDEITGLVPKLGQWGRDLGHGIPLFAKDGLAYMQVGHQVGLAGCVEPLEVP